MPRGDSKGNILAAARNVFSQKGFRASTVDDLLKEAGVARGTFYRYFPNKRQVFVELLQGILRIQYENAKNFVLRDTKDAETFSKSLKESLIMFYRIFLENRFVVLVFYREAFGQDPALSAVWNDFENRMTMLFSEVLEQGIQENMFRPMDTRLVAKVILVVFMQIPFQYSLSMGRIDVDIEEMAEEMVELAMRGILAESRKSC